MKFAVSTYSFSQLMNNGEITQLGCIKKAKELGFDGVELVDIAAYAGDDLNGYAKQLAQEAEKNDIILSNLAFGADLINGSNADFQAEIERMKKMIDAAAILKVPSIRHDVLYQLGNYRSFYHALPRLAEGCRIIAEYAAGKGIRTMSENHGFICQDSIRMEQLFHAVDHPNFSLLADIGNFLCVDEDPVTAVSRIAPYAAYVHAKDFLLKSGREGHPGDGFFQTRGGNYLRGTIIGHGVVPVRQCLNALRRAGYNGFITVEFEGMEPALTGIAIGLKNLKTLLKDEI